MEQNLALTYRRLGPNEVRQCEGEGIGQQCAYEAQCEILSSDNPLKLHYCETHFQTVRKACFDNGFKLGMIGQEGIS